MKDSSGNHIPYNKKEYKKLWNKRNPQKIQKYYEDRKKTRIKNPKIFLEYQRKYRKNNKEKYGIPILIVNMELNKDSNNFLKKMGINAVFVNVKKIFDRPLPQNGQG